MPDELKERWQILCEKASTEHDPGKLTTLIQELSDALEEREQAKKRSSYEPGK